MACGFTISPPVKHPKPRVEVTIFEEPPCLTLTCFGPNVKLDFENIPIGTTAKREVIIKNPTGHDIMIYVVNLPPSDQGVTLNWHMRSIKAHECDKLEISWAPIAETSWRHTFKLEDGARIKKTIPVVFKSVRVTKKLEKKMTNLFKSHQNVANKENLGHRDHYKKETFINNSFFIQPTTDIRRETYTINSIKPLQNVNVYEPRTNNETFPIACKQDLLSTTKEFSDDSLEISQSTFVINESPLTKRNSTYVLDTKIASPTISTCKITVTPNAISIVLSQRKRKSNSVFDITPPKRLQFDEFQRVSSTPKPRKQQKPLTSNPFLSPFAQQTWLDEQQEHMKKWLNLLLAPPSELHSSTETHTVDVAKLWRECKNQVNNIPAGKEVVSSCTRNRLDSLRISARNLYKSGEITQVLSAVNAIIDSNKLAIRGDRNVHANVAIHTEIVSILLCYNPLWLRIGLETIYNTTITLSSNSDIIGLTNFLMQRFFKDPVLIKKHKSVFAVKYIVDIKKFILKQFLALVYFLDIAKTKTLILHDPCLFCKNAPHKASCEILFAFTRELLAGIGDITRFMKRFNYTVCHEQRFIHEFDYSVVHLGCDLQDGIRLTKVMEILLGKAGLIDKLRVPAISKLQKVYNMEIVFVALAEADFEISDVSPRDVVEGHCEKTLSFLWQIIYKFQAPIYINAASKIQAWWRSFPIKYKRHILLKPHRAANKIQNFFKMVVQRNHYIQMKIAAITIQCRFQATILMKQERTNFLLLKEAIIKTQRLFRAKKTAQFDREQFLALKQAAITIQRRFRFNRLAQQERATFILVKESAIKIQRLFRARKAAQLERGKFVALKQAAVAIQKRFRANRLAKQGRAAFILQKESVITLQRLFRANKAAQLQREKFVAFKHAAIAIQRRFRANKLGKQELAAFNLVKESAIKIQRMFRANKAAQLQREKFVAFKHAAVTIQRSFRANRLGKQERAAFILVKESAIKIQRLFRAKKATQLQREKFVALKQAAVAIQRRFRANRLGKQERTAFIFVKESAIKIQRMFRAKKAAQLEQKKFVALKQAAIAIQRRFRANKLAKHKCAAFILQKESIIKIQRLFRAKKAAQLQREKFVTHKQATVAIQRRFRSNKLGKQERAAFILVKESAIKIQRLFRANKAAQLEREKFVALKQASITIQRRFRANRLASQERAVFILQKQSIIKIQHLFRAKKAAQIEREKFAALKQAVVTIQRRFRANRLGKQERAAFILQKESVIKIQRLIRAKKVAQLERENFFALKQAAIAIQRRFRANRLGKQERAAFVLQKESVIKIQRLIRAKKVAQLKREKFVALKQASITIQRRFRANRLASQERTVFIWQKQSIIKIQRLFRAKKAAQLEREKHFAHEQAVLVIQRYFRRYKEIEKERKAFLAYRNRRKKAAITIQSFWRGYQVRKSQSKFLAIHRTMKETLPVSIPQNTLGTRKEFALQILNAKNPSLVSIISALEDLDYITRCSKDICIFLSTMLPDILYRIVKLGNRSFPDMKACAAATGILINFYKYPPASLSAWMPEHLKDIFLVMSHCCDKEDKLFLYLSTLVWLFAHDENRKNVIKEMPNFAIIINKMRVMNLRKQKMVLQQTYKFFSKFVPYSELPEPNCAPDWGLEYPQRPRLFTNCVHAMNSLFKILD